MATVTLVSMGPAGTGQGIRQALAMGADDADPDRGRLPEGLGRPDDCPGAGRRDRAKGFDLVIAGTESTDGYSGVVPQMLAELLGVPALTYANQVEAAEGSVTIHRQTAAGYDVVEPRTTRRGVGDRRRGRAPLPDLQGDHGRQEEADRDASAWATWRSDAAPEQSVLAIVDAPERTGGRKIEDDGEAHQRDRRPPRTSGR